MRVRRVVVYIIPLSIIFSGEIARQESAYLQIPVLPLFFIRFHYFPFFTTTATTAFFPLERVNVILHCLFFRAVTTALLLITATSAFDVFIRTNPIYPFVTLYLIFFFRRTFNVIFFLETAILYTFFRIDVVVIPGGTVVAGGADVTCSEGAPKGACVFCGNWEAVGAYIVFSTTPDTVNGIIISRPSVVSRRAT